MPRRGKSGMWNVRDLARIGLLTAVLSVCSWISIPLAVPITLQTLAVCLTVGLLDRRDGMAVIFLYLLLGAVGLPVFSGMKGGPGALLGPTGGYLLGFLATGFLAGSIIKRFGRSMAAMIVGFALGIAACYLFGTMWYVWQYAETGAGMTLWKGLCQCVFPFCLPDGGKILLAAWLVRRLYPILNREQEWSI